MTARAVQEEIRRAAYDLARGMAAWVLANERQGESPERALALIEYRLAENALRVALVKVVAL